METNIRVLVSEEEIVRRIRNVARRINEDYEGEEVHLVCILKGSVFFACALASQLTVPVTMDFMSVSSYGDETVSSGRVKILKDLDESIRGKNVIVVEDIIDTGRTLLYLKNFLQTREPKSLKLCALLDKPVKREAPIDLDYRGLQIQDAFVVGCGLDFEQKYRNLPYIGVIEKRKNKLEEEN